MRTIDRYIKAQEEQETLPGLEPMCVYCDEKPAVTFEQAQQLLAEQDKLHWLKLEQSPEGWRLTENADDPTFWDTREDTAMCAECFWGWVEDALQRIEHAHERGTFA